MMVAKLNGVLVEAERGLGRDKYVCPLCLHEVVLKPGRVKVAHFAHAPGSDCPASEHEGAEHLAAKKVLTTQFRKLGYLAQPEEALRDRRVDIAVTMPTKHRVAV